jgi:Protein of unknown function (DUF692)
MLAGWAGARPVHPILRRAVADDTIPSRALNELRALHCNLYLHRQAIDTTTPQFWARTPDPLVHLAGHAEQADEEGEPLLIDSHDRPVADAVWKLFDTVARLGFEQEPDTRCWRRGRRRCW